MTLAILCPGQGRQHAHMLDLVAQDADAQAVLAQATRALGRDPREWLREPAAITRNAIAQPLVCIAALAAWRALAKRIPAPALHAGLSVGELASYACAGALDPAALCALARARALAMDGAWRDRQGGLAVASGLDRAALDALCRAYDVWPAIVFDARSLVVGGARESLEAFAVAAGARGARITQLAVDVPSHTPLLAAAVPVFRAALVASELRDPIVPVVAGVDASLVTRRDDAVRALSRQLAEPIDWLRVLETLVERGCRVFVEVGCGTALSRMVNERFADVHARSLDDFRSLDGAAAWVRARLAE